MQEDSFPAAEKIIADLENVLKKDLKLKAFEILPVTLNENKSPVVHAEHCLGLESWCVRHVYTHAYNHIMSIRKHKRKREDPSRLSKLLIGALIINPEVTTFWNMRKELLLQKKIDQYFELHFTNVILSRKPKCAEIFSHRKWIIQNIMKEWQADPGFITNELHVCEMASSLYSNNYHAWTHRIWCLNQLNQSSVDLITVLHHEWPWCEKWISSHVSDYSGFHYRQHVLTKVIHLCEDPFFSKSVNGFIESVNEATEFFLKSVSLQNFVVNVKILALPLRILISEFLLNTNLISTFPGHEALWCHRRFILFKFKELILRYNCNEMTIKIWGFTDIVDDKNSDGEPLEKNKKVEINSMDRFAMLLSVYEERFIIKYLVGLSNSEEIEYCRKHKHWLEKVLKMQLPYNLDLLK